MRPRRDLSQPAPLTASEWALNALCLVGWIWLPLDVTGLLLRLLFA